MLMYLTSGAADVTLLARGFAWGGGASNRLMAASAAELERPPKLLDLLPAAQALGAGDRVKTPAVDAYMHTGEENVTAEALGHGSGKDVEEREETAFISRLSAAADRAAGVVAEGAASGAASGAAEPAPAPVPAPVPAPAPAPAEQEKAAAPPSLSPRPHALPQIPIKFSVSDGKKHTGTGAQEAVGHRVEGEARPHTLPRLVSSLKWPINATALHARLCRPREAGAPEPVWSTCCAQGAGGLPALLSNSSAAGGVVEEARLPTFTCTAQDARNAFLPIAVSIPCSRAEDDFCDCSADGADEYLTNACAHVPNTFFYCASGGRMVEGGALVRIPSVRANSKYIPATNVRDGIVDCNGGEDEAPYP